MKRMICALLVSLLILTVCACTSGENEEPTETPTAASTEAQWEDFCGGHVSGSETGYEAVADPEDHSLFTAYKVHFWYTLEQGYVYKDAKLLVTVTLTFGNGAVQSETHTLCYDENGQLTGETPVTDDGETSIQREITIDEANRACDFFDTNVDFTLAFEGTAARRG